MNLKQLLLLLVVIIPTFCYAQKDPCRKINRSIDDKGTTTFSGPQLKHIRALKQFKDNVYFGLLLQVNDLAPHFDAVGVVIEFEDGTTLRNDEVKITCKQEATEISGGYASAPSVAHSGQYVLQGFFPIKEENMALFANKKIVKIQLAGAPQSIPEKEAEQTMAYIGCLKEVKP